VWFWLDARPGPGPASQPSSPTGWLSAREIPRVCARLPVGDVQIRAEDHGEGTPRAEPGRHDGEASQPATPTATAASAAAVTRTRTAMAVDTGDPCGSDELTSSSPLTGPAEPFTGRPSGAHLPTRASADCGGRRKRGGNEAVSPCRPQGTQRKTP
jgi:hypothetical protein